MKNYDEEQTVFQERLIALRKREKLSQSKFADAIGVSRSSVRDWETGDKLPGFKILLRIADYFGVTVDYLAGRDSQDSLYVGDLPEEVSLKFGELIRLYAKA